MKKYVKKYNSKMICGFQNNLFKVRRSHHLFSKNEVGD